MIALVTSAMMLAAGGYDTVFDESVAAYDNGDYARSVALLEELIEQGITEDEVFYNLGNAYFRLGRYGEAIANYERVLQVNPRHRDAERNLEKALDECPRALARPLPPEWERAVLFWHGGLSRPTSGMLAVALWLAGWTLLAIRRFRPLPYASAAGAALIAVGALFGASWYAKSHPQPTGVVVKDTLPVRYGMDEDDKVRFELFEGDRVLIEAQEGEWIRIATIGRERGWTKASGIVSVGPPYRGFDETPADRKESGA